MNRIFGILSLAVLMAAGCGTNESPMSSASVPPTSVASADAVLVTLKLPGMT